MLLILLLLWCGYTTFTADFPSAALEKWDWVWKALVFAIFLPFTLRTRLRLEGLLLFMVLSASSIIVVGGVKTLLGGGGYGTLNLGISDNSGLYEGSTISTVAIAIIPTILFLARYGTIFPRGWMVRVYSLALVGACLLIPIGTATRTGLICIGLVAIMGLRDSKRRILYIGAMAAAVAIAIPSCRTPTPRGCTPSRAIRPTNRPRRASRYGAGRGTMCRITPPAAASRRISATIS